MVLALDGPTSVQGHDTTDHGQPAYGCTFPLTLVTRAGRSGETATFDSAGYQIQVENGPSYSGDLPTGNLFYPHTGISAGDTLIANFPALAAGPFQFSAVLYYSGPAASYGSTAYTATCE